MFGAGAMGFEPRRALAASGPVDSGNLHDIRLGLVGLEGDVLAARGWFARFRRTNHEATRNKYKTARTNWCALHGTF